MVFGEANLTLADVVCQAKKLVEDEIIQVLKAAVEQLLLAQRNACIEQLKQNGIKAYRWGYKRRKWTWTVLGQLIDLKIPRVRTPNEEVVLMERYTRWGKDFMMNMLLASVGGISYRRLSLWLKEFCSSTISPSLLSTMIRKASASLTERRSSRLEGTEYAALVVDGVWSRRRRKKKQGKRPKVVLITAIGVRWNGTWKVLDWEAAHSEHLAAYERLLTRLFERGLEEISLIVGDDTEALKSAKEMVYPKANLQMCAYHLQKNLEALLSDKSIQSRRRLRRDFWRIFDSLDTEEMQRELSIFRNTWKEHEPQVVSYLCGKLPYCFHYMSYPPAWRHRLRTTNLAEGFFMHLRKFLRRFPGFGSMKHKDQIMEIFLLALEHPIQAQQPAFNNIR